MRENHQMKTWLARQGMGARWLALALLGSLGLSAQEVRVLKLENTTARAVTIDPETGEEIEIDPGEIQSLLQSVQGKAFAKGRAVIVNGGTGEVERFELNAEDLSELFQGNGLQALLEGENRLLGMRPWEAIRTQLTEQLGPEMAETVLSRLPQPKNSEDFRGVLEIEDDEEWKIVRQRLSSVLARLFKDPLGSPSLQVMGELRSRLRQAIESDTEGDLESAIKDYRKAAESRDRQLEEARDALRELLSLVQEAKLVSWGVLD